MNETYREPPIETKPLRVAVVDGEIVVAGFASTSPSVTANVARETAQQLIEAAELLERRTD